MFYFTGRETELQDLRQRVEAGQKSVLVSGMGGVGKTQICRKLFAEYRETNGRGEHGCFDYIGFIEYNGDMGSSLQECLWYKRQENPELDRESAWTELERLASGGKLLLFVDNVNRHMGRDPGLERLNQIPGAVVITSRLVSFSDEFEPYKIGFLVKKQCREIYERIRFEGSGKNVGPEERRDLDYIIENLAGRHTITIQFLAYLAREKRWPIKELRSRLEKKGFRLEFHKNGEPVNMQESYEALYNMSELSDAEQNILEAFSVFPYSFLDADVCSRWLLKDAGMCEEDSDILMGLYEKGWLQFEIERESYALHPVFAQFIYEKCRPGAGRHSGLIHACNKSRKIPGSGSPFGIVQYLPFAESIVEKLELGEDYDHIFLVDSVAYLQYYISNHDRAEELYKKNLQVREKVLGEEHPDTATSYNNLAGLYANRNEYECALNYYLNAYQVFLSKLGGNHPNTQTVFNKMKKAFLEWDFTGDFALWLKEQMETKNQQP